VRDAKLATRDMHAQLADRKQANVRLTTENERLKDMLAQMQMRLGDIELSRHRPLGESISKKGLRSTVSDLLAALSCSWCHANMKALRISGVVTVTGSLLTSSLLESDCLCMTISLGRATTLRLHANCPLPS
jgi:hypothetical protein